MKTSAERILEFIVTAQAVIGCGRLDGEATENNERLLRRPVAVNYVFITGSLEMEIVSAVTKGLNIAGKLQYCKVVAT